MFWAITIPITIAVVLVWRQAMYFSGAKWIKALLCGKMRRKKKEKGSDVEMGTMSNGSKPKQPAITA